MKISKLLFPSLHKKISDLENDKRLLSDEVIIKQEIIEEKNKIIDADWEEESKDKQFDIKLGIEMFYPWYARECSYSHAGFQINKLRKHPRAYEAFCIALQRVDLVEIQSHMENVNWVYGDRKVPNVSKLYESIVSLTVSKHHDYLPTRGMSSGGWEVSFLETDTVNYKCDIKFDGDLVGTYTTEHYED